MFSSGISSPNGDFGEDEIFLLWDAVDVEGDGMGCGGVMFLPGDAEGPGVSGESDLRFGLGDAVDFDGDPLDFVGEGAV